MSTREIIIIILHKIKRVIRDHLSPDNNAHKPEDLEHIVDLGIDLFVSAEASRLDGGQTWSPIGSVR